MSNKIIWTFENFSFYCNYYVRRMEPNWYLLHVSEDLDKRMHWKISHPVFYDPYESKNKFPYDGNQCKICSLLSPGYENCFLCVSANGTDLLCVQENVLAIETNIKKNVHMSFQWLQNFRLIICRGTTCKFKYFLICITKGYIRKLSLVY